VVILVSGLPRSGKDTFADIATAYGFTRKAFADIPKQILARTFDISLDELDYLKNNEVLHYKQISKNSNITFRKLLQRFCTEGMQTVFGKNVWSKLLLQEIKNDLVVIPDFRFLAEYDTLSGLDVVTVHIDNKDSKNYTHSSDTELIKEGFKFDYNIINNNTLEEYNIKCKRTIELILKDR